MDQNTMYRFTATSSYSRPTVLEGRTPDALASALAAEHYLPWLQAWVRDELQFPDFLPKALTTDDGMAFRLEAVTTRYVFTEIAADGEIVNELSTPINRLMELVDALYDADYREWVVQWAIAMADPERADELPALLAFPASGVTYSLVKVIR